MSCAVQLHHVVGKLPQVAAGCSESFAWLSVMSGRTRIVVSAAVSLYKLLECGTPSTCLQAVVLTVPVYGTAAAASQPGGRSAQPGAAPKHCPLCSHVQWRQTLSGGT